MGWFPYAVARQNLKWTIIMGLKLWFKACSLIRSPLINVVVHPAHPASHGAGQKNFCLHTPPHTPAHTHTHTSQDTLALTKKLLSPPPPPPPAHTHTHTSQDTLALTKKLLSPLWLPPPPPPHTHTHTPPKILWLSQKNFCLHLPPPPPPPAHTHTHLPRCSGSRLALQLSCHECVDCFPANSTWSLIHLFLLVLKQHCALITFWIWTPNPEDLWLQ